MRRFLAMLAGVGLGLLPLTAFSIVAMFLLRNGAILMPVIASLALLLLGPFLIMAGVFEMGARYDEGRASPLLVSIGLGTNLGGIAGAALLAVIASGTHAYDWPDSLLIILALAIGGAAGATLGGMIGAAFIGARCLLRRLSSHLQRL